MYRGRESDLYLPLPAYALACCSMCSLTIRSRGTVFNFTRHVSFYTKKRKLQPQVYGPESSGKTTLALHAIAEVQRQGGVAALIDAEHAFDPEYSRVRAPNVLSPCLAAAYRVARMFAHRESPHMCLYLLTFNFTS